MGRACKCNTVYTVCAFSVARVFSLLEDGGVATKVNVCTSTCMCICTMLYLIVFYFFELFTYLNKIFVAFDQWGSDNRGFTVVCLCTDTSGHMSGAHAMQQCMSMYSALAVCTNLTLWAPYGVANRAFTTNILYVHAQIV